MNSLLSVVTICFNNLPELVATCQSVDGQSASPEEHLIIDGSTDNLIINWLEQHPQPPYRRWIHERDQGISDAFNKGVARSTGDIIHLLNSGDKYATTKAIEMVMAVFETEPTLQWTHSQYIQHRGNVDVVSGGIFDPAKLWRGMRTVAHPTMFIKRGVYDRHGRYDTGYKIAMDFDLLVRIRDEQFKFISVPLVYFAPGGASNIHFKKGLAEVRKSYSRHIGSSLPLAAWQFRQRLLHFSMQTGFGRKVFQWKNSRNKA